MVWFMANTQVSVCFCVGTAYRRAELTKTPEEQKQACFSKLFYLKEHFMVVLFN